MMLTADIIIVGAGMVGATAALALATAGFEVIVIDPRREVPAFPLTESEFDIKVVALSRASEDLFKKLTVWPENYIKRVCAYQQMVVWDSIADGLIRFSAHDFFEPNLGHIVEQQLLQAAIWQKLATLSNVKLLIGESLKTLSFSLSQVNVTTTTYAAVAKLVIGADGAHSLVKKLAGIEQKGWDYQQSAIVATVQGSQSHQATAFQRFACDGPLALLPLADPTLSSIVWTTTPSRAQHLCALSAEEFNKELTREISGVTGELKVISERQIFALKTHHVNRYAIERCVLIGDAAHTLHPLAGQGVNLGLADVASLTKVLNAVKTKGRDFGKLEVLRRYQRQRWLANELMILAMESFKRGFASRNPSIIACRNAGLNWVNNHIALKRCFARVALGAISI